MIVVEESAFCWHGICSILHDYTFFTPRHAIKRSFQRQIFAALHGFLRAMLAPSHDAKAVALGVGDSYKLGFLCPGIQRKTDNQNKATYVSHLIGMALGAIDVANGEVYFCSNHGFKSLPTAAQALNGGGRTINLRTGGLYTYLFATYDAYGSEVWYIGNLSGIITIPFLAPGHYLTGWTLFGPRGVGGSGWWHYGNVARCGSRHARLGATLPNALALHLIQQLTRPYARLDRCSKSDMRAVQGRRCAEMKRQRAVTLIGIVGIAGALAFLVAFPAERVDSEIPTIKTPGPYPYETPGQVPAPPPDSDSSPLPAPAPFPYSESTSSLSAAQERDSRTAAARRQLTPKAVREAAFKYNGVANFCGFLAALPADVSVFDPKLGRPRALVKGGHVVRKNVVWLRNRKQAAAHK